MIRLVVLVALSFIAGGCQMSRNPAPPGTSQEGSAEPRTETLGAPVSEKPAQQLRRILGAMKNRAVSYGWGEIEIGDGTELSSARAMFPDAPKGQAVIGSLTLTGDPIGVDLARAEFPVWTNSHDDEDWDPTWIASSLVLFDRALGIVAESTRGRNSADDVEANPLSQADIEKIVSTIRAADPEADADFWRAFFEQ